MTRIGVTKNESQRTSGPIYEAVRNGVRTLRRSGKGERAPLCDRRFADLLGVSRWAQLPPSIRKRFSKRLRPGDWTLYRGAVAYTRFSTLGWFLAQICRSIGGPLPICRASNVPALVAVTSSDNGEAQIWTRVYGRPSQFHQVVHSEKRFQGPTGLEEYVGWGLGMTLSLAVESNALVFRSHSYFLDVFGRRFLLPAWLSPGDMEIVHAEELDGQFSFTLRLTHAIAGRLVTQLAYFEEVDQ